MSQHCCLYMHTCCCIDYMLRTFGKTWISHAISVHLQTYELICKYIEPLQIYSTMLGTRLIISNSWRHRLRQHWSLLHHQSLNVQRQLTTWKWNWPENGRDSACGIGLGKPAQLPQLQSLVSTLIQGPSCGVHHWVSDSLPVAACDGPTLSWCHGQGATC